MSKIIHTLIAADLKIQYDTAVKRLLNCKPIFAYIIQQIIDAYKDATLSNIASLMESPCIGSLRLMVA